MSSLHKRILSALVLGPLVIAAVWFGGYAFYGMMALTFAISVQEWFKLCKRDTGLLWAWFAAGIIYIFAACFAALWLRDHTGAGLYLLLYVLFAIWACDSGAYMTGKTIGGPKMAPTISPNKTWAGLVGGVVCAAITTALYNHFMPIESGGEFMQARALPVHLLLGAFLAVVGQLGDLKISALKRQAGLKDTGNIIPGHGGLLDRIDALLLVLPIFAAIVSVLERFA